MFRRLLLSLAVLATVVIAGMSSAEARHCGGGRGFYGGGFYGGGYRAPVYHSARYYGGPSYYRRAPVYSRSYYAAPAPAYYGRRGGVSLSFGF